MNESDHSMDRGARDSELKSGVRVTADSNLPQSEYSPWPKINPKLESRQEPERSTINSKRPPIRLR